MGHASKLILNVVRSTARDVVVLSLMELIVSYVYEMELARLTGAHSMHV